MKLASHKTYFIYFVVDHEDDERWYQFDSKESALKWKQELIEVFEANQGNISVLERQYDEFGNWLLQNYI